MMNRQWQNHLRYRSGESGTSVTKKQKKWGDKPVGDSVVISYIIAIWILWLIALILLIALFVVFSLVKSIRRYRWSVLIPLFLVTVFVSVPTILGLLDVKNDSYVTEHVAYYRADESNTHNNIAASDAIQITFDDGSYLILRGARNSLPYGRYTGTVTYAKRSKIIISFVPDSTS